MSFSVYRMKWESFHPANSEVLKPGLGTLPQLLWTDDVDSDSKGVRTE